MKDTSLTMRAQEIIAQSETTISAFQAARQALAERCLTYDELLDYSTNGLVTAMRDLRKRLYDLPEQDTLDLDIPSAIGITSPDGDLFIGRDHATLDQVRQWADEGQQHHSTQNLRFKRFKERLRAFGAIDGSELWTDYDLRTYLLSIPNEEWRR